MNKKELKEKLDSGKEVILYKAFETAYDKTSKRFIASKEVKDSDDEIVDLAGGDFTRYLKNPVWLFGHRSSGDITDVIGKCEDLRMEYDKDNVKMFTYTGIYAPHPSAQILKQMHELDMLLATSIGFRVMEYDFDNNIITKWELYEISNVILPANSEAIAFASEKGLINATEKKDLLKEKMYPIYKKKLKEYRDAFMSDELFMLLGLTKTDNEVANLHEVRDNIINILKATRLKNSNETKEIKETPKKLLKIQDIINGMA